jgi:hypothetical protein
VADAIEIPIVGRDEGATRVLKDVAGASDLAARSARALADAEDKQRRAMAASVGATLAQAKADKILADSSDEAIAKVAGERLAHDQAAKAKEDDKAATQDLTKATGLLASGSAPAVSGIGALVGAGAALAPVVATLGFGLTGLAAAAYGIVKPIANAAQGTGGLQKNLKTLDPIQRQAAISLLGLKKTYDEFQADLKPVVFQDFAAAIGLVTPLLHDLEPVSAAVGKSLATMLNQLSATFAGPQWQGFFAFMARTAPTDVGYLTTAITNLIGALPQLLENLQPISEAILQITAAASQLLGPLNQVITIAEKSNQAQFKAARGVDSWATSILNSIPGLKQVSDSITADQKAVDRFFHSTRPAADGTKKLGEQISVTAGWAQIAATNIGNMATQVKNLSTQQANALTTQINYTNALLTAANDADALKKALQQSGNQIGFHTAAQRASFQAANTYITDLSNEAQMAIASGKGAKTAAADIRGGLPVLDQAKSKSRLYWQEVKTLKHWLDLLSLVPMIREKILVTGAGQWSVTAALHKIAQGPGPFAAGGVVPGTGNSDSFPAMLTPGEVVVPKRMVAAGAVNHLRGRLPGFATGGLVPHYSGGVPGIQPWATRNMNVATSQIITGVASSMAAAFAAQVKKMAASMLMDTGARSGNATVAQSFAASVLPRGWSFPDLLALWNQESGWNAYAVNPSSGAYGIPQCYTTDMMILTRRGWLKHDEVRVGDETIGYNPATGRSEWTKVTAVLRPGVHRVVRYGNSRVEFTTTPNHRWLMWEKHSRTESMREIQHRLWRNSLVLAKPATTGPGLPITDQEAALLGWIAGDGWERKAYPRYGKGRGGGSPATFHILQTKQENWPAIEAAVGEHGRVVRTRERAVHGEPRLDREWRLLAPYARDLVERAGHPRNACVRQVTAMSDSQRAAWLDALFLAEGHLEAGNRAYSQNQGALADAIKLALYLEGLRPSWYERHDARYGTTSLAIRGVKPTLGVGHPGFFYEDAGEAEVWCVTTELGTFTAEQNGHIHLTGNSLGHGHPYNLGDYKAQIIWGLNYIASRYGNSQNAWAHEQAYNWYDKGGLLPPGLSLALNTTGRPERVVPAGSSGNITVHVHIDPTIAAVTPDRRLGQHIGQHVTAAIRGGMALYPAGINPR